MAKDLGRRSSSEGSRRRNMAYDARGRIDGNIRDTGVVVMSVNLRLPRAKGTDLIELETASKNMNVNVG